MPYGPLVQKTFVENWLQSAYGFVHAYSAQPELIPKIDQDRFKYDTTEGALFYDQYPQSQGISSLIKFHKDYSITLQADVKSPSAVSYTAANGDIVTNPKYWNGIVLWAAISNYHALVQVDRVAGTVQETRLACGEDAGSSSTSLQSNLEDTYYQLRLEYTPSTGKVKAIVNQALKADIYHPLEGNTPISYITTNDITDTHTGGWVKTMTATGVVVTGFCADSAAWQKAIFNSSNISVTPCQSTTVPRIKSGLELIHTLGKRTYDTEPEGTHATSGSTDLTPLIAPNLYSWDALNFVKTVASGTISIQVLDEFGNLIPDSIIPGNSSRISINAISSLNISAIDAVDYPRIRCRVFMTTSNTAMSPVLYELYATFSTTTDVLSFVKLPAQVWECPWQVAFAGSPVTIPFRIVDHADYDIYTELRIYDSTSTLVRTVVTSKNVGHQMGYGVMQSIIWDGKNDGGTTLSNGTYSVVVMVKDSLNNTTLSRDIAVGNVVLPTIAGTPTGIAVKGTTVHDTISHRTWTYDGKWRSAPALT